MSLPLLQLPDPIPAFFGPQAIGDVSVNKLSGRVDGILKLVEFDELHTL